MDSRYTVVEREAVTKKIQDFYASLPFNFHATKEKAAETIRSENPVGVYQDLDALLKKADPQAKILDVGCGSGWFVNSAAYHYGLTVVGIDLCEKALDRAREVSLELGIENRASFQQLDLFNLRSLETRFFLVNSLGVLHHTFSCHQSLREISLLVQDKGFLHLGLYHQYGREPFLRLFKPYRERIQARPSSKEREEIEEEAFALYRELNKPSTDETFLFSWFQDQVFHPHESQHTVEELTHWLEEIGFQCISTSINRFQKVNDWRIVFKEEKSMRDISTRRNYVEKVFFPGFFTLLAEKK